MQLLKMISCSDSEENSLFDSLFASYKTVSRLMNTSNKISV